MFTTISASQSDILKEIHSAITSNEIKKAKNLLKTVDIDSSLTVDGDTALHEAANANKLDFAIWLLAQGANPNIQDNHGMTPLHSAVLKNYLPIVQRLIAMQANPNIPETFNGNTPFHMAIAWRHINIAKYLLEHNADPNKQNKKGESALYWSFLASEKCYNPEEARSFFDKKIQSIKILLENPNTDINLQDTNGDSILLMLPQGYQCFYEVNLFSEKQIIQLLTMLIEHKKINLEIRNKQNETIFDIVSCMQSKTSKRESFLHNLLEKTIVTISNPKKPKELREKLKTLKELEEDFTEIHSNLAKIETESFKFIQDEFNLKRNEFLQQHKTILAHDRKDFIEAEESQRQKFLTQHDEFISQLRSSRQQNESRLLSLLKQKADHLIEESKRLSAVELSERNNVKDTQRKEINFYFSMLKTAQLQSQEYVVRNTIVDKANKELEVAQSEFNNSIVSPTKNQRHQCSCGNKPLVCAFLCHHS
jgi:ankyrin repeat protein